MANTLLTTSQITNEILDILSQRMTFLKRINRNYDDSFAQTGAKIGNVISIRVPTNSKIRQGRQMDAGNMLDKVVPLTITDQTGVDLVWNSADQALSIDDFRARYLEQPIANMMSWIEGQVISRALPYTYNTIPNTDGVIDLLDALQASKVLTDNLAPTERFMLTNTMGTIQMVNANKGLFNAQTQIGNQYEEGLMLRAAGFDWYETTNMPTQVRGTANTAYTVNGANQTGSTLAVTGGTGTMNAGDTFTIANVFAVNPATKVSTGSLQTFVVTANYAGGAGNVSIAPAIVGPGDPQQNVSVLPAAGAAITVNGTSGTTTGVNLGFARDFVTFATVDLPLPPNKDASRKQFQGISVRMIMDYDTINDQFLNRVDILWGSAVLRPEFGVKIPNDITKVA